MRDPNLSASNSGFAQIFRKLSEVSDLGGTDEFFEQLKTVTFKTDQGMRSGAEVMASHGGASSFADVAKWKAGSRKKFFETIFSGLDQFTGSKGGGTMGASIYKAREGQVGLLAGSFLDQDGDTVKTIMLSAIEGKQYLGLLGKNPTAHLSERNTVDFMAGIAKQGMSNYAKSLGKTLDPVAEGVLKEIGMDQMTGRLDVSLRPAHDALLNFGDNTAMAKQISQMFGVLTEFASIKSKKLEVFSHLPDELAHAMKALQDTDDIGLLETLMKERIFKGTDFAAGRTTDVTPDLSHMPKAIQKVMKNVKHSSINIDDMLAHIKTVMTKQKMAGGASVTGKQMTAGLEDNLNSANIIRNARTGSDMAGAAMHTYAGDTAENLVSEAENVLGHGKRILDHLDNKSVGALALGAMGSLALMGIMGNQGYSNEPLIMPGEGRSPRTAGQVAAGNLFSSRQIGMNAEEMASRGSYATMNPVLEAGSTYVQKPNGYQIRGETNSGYGLGSLGNYWNQVSGGTGRGSLMVNDARRPITSAYTDRLMGEY